MVPEVKLYKIFEDYDREGSFMLHRLNLEKIGSADIFVDRTYQYLPKKSKRRPGTVVSYCVRLNAEDLSWIALTMPEVVVKEVSTSL